MEKWYENRMLAVTAIHTDAGKTLISAIISMAFSYSYWKPVQAGNLSRSDTDIVRWLTGGRVTTYPEWQRLRYPLSPHYAALKEKKTIDVREIKFPPVSPNEKLLIEGAGGIFSPVDSFRTFADFLKMYSIPFILVINDYLGNITHTIGTILALRSMEMSPAAVIFNRVPAPIRKFIIDYCALTTFYTIGKIDTERRGAIKRYVYAFRRKVLVG